MSIHRLSLKCQLLAILSVLIIQTQSVAQQEPFDPTGFLSGALGEKVESIPLPEDYYPGLRDILMQAGQQAPELVLLGIDSEISQQNLRIARSRHYPTLGVGGNIGYRFTQRQGEDNDGAASASVSLGANRPLYFWGAVNAGIQKGEIDYETRVLTSQQRFLNTVQTLRNQYMDLILNEMELRNARLRKNNLEQQIAQKESNFDAGRISEEEYLSFLIQLDQSLVEIDELIVARDDVVDEFRRISGVTDDLELPTGVAPIDLDELQEAILADDPNPDWVRQTYSVQIRENELEKQERDAIIIRSRQRPNVSLSASISQAPVNTATQNDVDTIRYFAGLSVSWNIFDGFATQASRRINLLQGRRLESEMRNDIDRLVNREREVRNELMIMIRKQRLAERRFDLDSRIYSRVKSDYEVGRISSNEFRTTQINYYQQELFLHIARAELLRAVGDYLTLLNEDRGLRFFQFQPTGV